MRSRLPFIDHPDDTIMTRLSFSHVFSFYTIRVLALCLISIFGVTEATNSAEQSSSDPKHINPPNLLVLIAPEIGYGDLQCYGNVNIATPALDSLAYEGVRFTQFTTTGPDATAAQYSLLTGRVIARSGIASTPLDINATGWHTQEWTLAEMLRRCGYENHFVGQWLLGIRGEGSHPLDQGFQHFFGLPADLSVTPPLMRDREIVEESPERATLLDSLRGDATNIINSAKPPFSLVFQVPHLIAKGESLAGAHGNRVEAVDHIMGEWMKALDARHLRDNTLVLFLSTGGATRTGDSDGGSNGMLRDGAGSAWEGGLRAPMIARLPSVLPAGKMNLALLWLPDLMPSLTALIGGEIAPDERRLDGTNRLDILTASTLRTPTDAITYGLHRQGEQWATATVRRGAWKLHLLVHNTDPDNARPEVPGQLYHLETDPEERIDRSAQDPEQSKAILQSLAQEFTDSFPPSGESDLLTD